MPRRRKTSGFEDLIAVGALMQWWLTVILAVIAYFFFHHFASVMEPAPTTMEGLGTYAGRGLWKVVAGFAQRVVPIGLLFGAIVSAINRIKTRRHFEATAQLGTPGGLLQMSWQDFEKLVAEHFRRQDYQVTHTGRPGPDGGVALLSSTATTTTTPAAGAHFYYAKITQDDGSLLWSAPVWVNQGS